MQNRFYEHSIIVHDSTRKSWETQGLVARSVNFSKYYLTEEIPNLSMPFLGAEWPYYTE